MSKEQATYSHGHHESVVKSHAQRTAQNSAAFLLPHLRPTDAILDVGCGPGSITVDLANLVPQGSVIGSDPVEDVLDQARELAASRGAQNIRFEVADANSLPYSDHSFDVVYAHQVLQHVKNPIQLLKEMRRVVKPGGIVAARDSDYKSFTWYPESAGLDKWASIYQRVAKANGGEPNAGRRLLKWAREAGFKPDEIETTFSSWCYTREEATWWANSWADRVLQSGFASSALRLGIATQREIEEVSQAYKDWGQQEDALFAVPSGEILCRVAMNSANILMSLNTLSTFLSNAQVQPLNIFGSISRYHWQERAVVLCGSGIVPIAEEVFSNLLTGDAPIAATLVICGGIGHSTAFLYHAAQNHPVYNSLTDDFDFDRPNKAEAEVLFSILQRHYAQQLAIFNSKGGRVLVENQSTNCGANAQETRRILERNNVTLPRSMLIVQDPTMALRTVAGFKKVYEDLPSSSISPEFFCCPTLVPKLIQSPDSASENTTRLSPSYLNFDYPSPSSLWSIPRFIDLLIGEVPRLRDDKNGYGPKGKGFIGHVDIPEEVESAWRRVGEWWIEVDETEGKGGRGKLH